MVFHGSSDNWYERLLQVSYALRSYVAKKAYPYPIVAICAELPEFRDNRQAVIPIFFINMSETFELNSKDTNEIRLNDGRFAHFLRNPTKEEIFKYDADKSYELPMSKDGSLHLTANFEQQLELDAALCN